MLPHLPRARICPSVPREAQLLVHPSRGTMGQRGHTWLWDILNPSLARTEAYGTCRVLGELASQDRTPRTAVCRREGPNEDKGHCGPSQRTAALGESPRCPCSVSSPTSQSGTVRSGRGRTRRHKDKMDQVSLFLKEKGEESLWPPGPGLSPSGASVSTHVLWSGTCAAGKTEQDHVFEASRGMLGT